MRKKTGPPRASLKKNKNVENQEKPRVFCVFFAFFLRFSCVVFAFFLRFFCIFFVFFLRSFCCSFLLFPGAAVSVRGVLGDPNL